MKHTSNILFPYPHWYDGKMYNGSIISFSGTCQKCKSPICKKNKNRNTGLCSMGYNYIYINNKITIAGVIVKNFKMSSQARNKRIRNEKERIIENNKLEMAIGVVREFYKKTDDIIQEKKEIEIEKYFDKEVFKLDYMDLLKNEIQKGLSFVHDYKQINSQISQNINVIIENSYDGNDIFDKLQKATREERAIYEASKYLSEKLNAAKFLIHPEWLRLQEECSNFRFHGIVHKYIQIYSPRCEAKSIILKMIGHSYNEMYANPKALSVIPHTFIDNAVKYSPKDGKIEVYIADIEDIIRFQVSSWGPRILPNEEKKIFQPFFRGESAKKIEEEGAGYGLYICQLIAKEHLGTEITVEQEQKQKPSMGHWTTFNIDIPKRAIIIEW